MKAHILMEEYKRSRAVVEFKIETVLAAKRRYKAIIMNMAIRTVVYLLYLKFFHNSLFIISTKIRIVTGTNILEKIIRGSKLSFEEGTCGKALR